MRCLPFAKETILICCGFLAICLVAVVGSATPASRIGVREEVVDTVLEVDGTSGHLFAVLRYDDGGDDCISVNLSIDDGVTWVETYELRSGLELDKDIGAAIVGDYLYVAYIRKSAVHSARLIRLRTSDGEYDPVYGANTVFTGGASATVTDVKVCSNVDSFDDHLYFFVISEDELRYFWSDQDGGAGIEPWNEVATGVTNACCGLDVTDNVNAHLGTGYNPIAAFMGTDWELFLWRYDGIMPEQIELDDPIYSHPEGQISLTAWDDHLALTYWTQAYEAKTCISNAAGDSRICEVVQLNGTGYLGDVTVRHGAGFAMVFRRDSEGCNYRRRDFGGTWSDPQPCSEVVAGSDTWLSFEALPPYGKHDYGGILISNDGVQSAAYFFRAPVIFLDGFESQDTAAWATTMP